MADMTNDNGTALLVPMYVDALVINQEITDSSAYNRWRMDYSQMNDFESPMLPPFQDQKTDPPSVGVHLHWTLPSGLRHGVGNLKGEIKFPFVPNRWLVVRTQSGESQAGASPVSGWIVLSDARGAHCTSSFLDERKSTAGQVVPTRLGDSKTLQEWDEMRGENAIPPVEPFLTAIAPGNVAFAAFAPAAENVFAFHDDLRDLRSTRTKLTYLVLGWYSDPESMDPLQHFADAWTCKFLFNVSSAHRADLDKGDISALLQAFEDFQMKLPAEASLVHKQEGSEWVIAAGDKRYTARLEKDYIYVYDSEVTIIDGLNWAVRLGDAPKPTHTYVHGSLYEVDWDPGGQLPPPPTCPDSREVYNKVRVAVGSNAVEALAALFSGQAENEVLAQAEILEALQHNLPSTLTEAEGKTLRDQDIRQTWFGSEPGGIRWTIVPKERSDSQADQKLPTITTEQEAELADLNRKQHELDAQRRRLASLQWDLFAVWWKSKRIDRAPMPRSGVRQEALHNAKRQLPEQLQARNSNSLLSRVIDLREAVTKLETDLAKDLATFADGSLKLDKLELKSVAMPRFWHPTDPAIVISGLGRSEKQHADDRSLFCRLLSQVISNTLTEVQKAAGNLDSVIPQLSSPHLPPCTNQLLTEAFFIDPGNAGIVARVSQQTLADQDAVRMAVDKSVSLIPEGLNPIGTYGSLAWQQPWVPLFLDWQVRFYPALKKNADGSYSFDQEGWQFKDPDYEWTGGQVSRSGSLSYSGRTFLTPQATDPLADSLRAYISSKPEAKTAVMEDLLARITQWDILSQSMSGFTSQLAMRDLAPSVLPEDSIKDHVGSNSGSIPYVNIVPDVDVTPGTETPFFFPLRAGFFAFQNLRIIDSFGRILDLMQANGNPQGNEQSFSPIRGRSMTSDGSRDTRLVKLAPRVVQSSRLSFRFVSAKDDSQETGLAVDSSPVCGWLLPNYLDNSIAVYDANGSLLGEILHLERSTEQETASWQPAPGNPDVQVDESTSHVVNQHLRSIIDALCASGRGRALSELLRVIDSTLEASAPLGQRGDQNLCVLIGRPLALVRANLQLELNGEPYYNQAWHETFQTGSLDFKKNHGGLLDLEVRIQLGSADLRTNGLMGYFQGIDKETDYRHFHAVQQLGAGEERANPPYVQQIGAGDNYLKLTFQPTKATSFDVTGSIYLTMLIDPRGMVQADSYLLPTKTVELPPAYFEDALKRMAVTFRVGPLLLDPKTVRIPPPAGQRGHWSWIQATDSGKWETSDVEKADARARFDGRPLALREGWLKFLPDDVEA